MTTLREAAQQALEALEAALSDDQPYIERCKQTITALRAALAEPVQEPDYWQEEARRYAGNADYWRKRYEALAEPVQEPVAWLDEEINCAYTPEELDGGTADGLVPLYTSPPQRKPLNEDQMYEACINVWRNLPSGFGHTSSEWIEAGIRYAERAHGIIATEVNGDKNGS